MEIRRHQLIGRVGGEVMTTTIHWTDTLGQGEDASFQESPLR